MPPKLTIKHIFPKGEYGHTAFSIRIRDDILAGLDDLSAKTGHSRNAIIGMLLEFVLDNCEVEQREK